MAENTPGLAFVAMLFGMGFGIGTAAMFLTALTSKCVNCRMTWMVKGKGL